MSNPMPVSLAAAIEPLLRVLHNPHPPAQSAPAEIRAGVALEITRVMPDLVIYRIADLEPDDDSARRHAAQLIVEGRLPQVAGVARLTAAEVTA